MTYQFMFRGERLDGVSQAKAQRNLARLFGVAEQDIEPLFNEEFEFVRGGLSEAMAMDYAALFKRAGTVGHIEALSQEASVTNELAESTTTVDDAPPQAVEENITPHPNADIDSGAEYGAHVLKQLSASQQAHRPENLPTPDTSVDSHQPKNNKDGEHKTASAEPPATARQVGHQIVRKTENRAARWLKIGGVAVVGTMLADHQLQSALVVDRYGLDLGLWPLLLAHIPLFIGCYLLAQEKRLAPLYRALGLLSFAGLSILMLLPKKGDKKHKISTSSLAVALFSCGVFAYWFGGAMQTSADTQALYDRLSSLHEGRAEYPSSTLQSDTLLYEAERTELHAVMRDIIELSNSDELRPDQASELASSMMAELGRYISWRHYQTFKFTTEGETLPESLNKESQKGDEAVFSALLRGISQQSNPRLYEEMLNWTVGPANPAAFVKTYGRRLPLNNLHTATMDAWLIQLEEKRDAAKKAELVSETSNSKPNFDVSTINLPTLVGATLVRHEHLVEYRFEEGHHQGKSLAIGFYTTKNKPRLNRKITYSPVYKVLNADVPSVNLSELASVFRHYNSNPVF